MIRKGFSNAPTDDLEDRVIVEYVGGRFIAKRRDVVEAMDLPLFYDAWENWIRWRTFKALPLAGGTHNQDPRWVWAVEHLEGEFQFKSNEAGGS